jgi:hypothetical protein
MTKFSIFWVKIVYCQLFVYVFSTFKGSWLTYYVIEYRSHRHSYFHNWSYNFRNIDEKLGDI